MCKVIKQKEIAKMENYNNSTITNNLVPALEAVREDMLDTESIDELIEETVAYIKRHNAPKNDDEAVEAMSQTESGAIRKQQGIWPIIGMVNSSIVRRLEDSGDDMDHIYRYIQSVPMRSPKKVATYYLTMRSARFLIDAAQAAFAQSDAAKQAKENGEDVYLPDLIKATDENIDQLVETIKSNKF